MARERFVSLDAARGIGAFSVVIWHWVHFFYQGTRPGDIATAAEPLYAPLRFLYSFGWMGVDFFFVLSGFIFFYFYYDSVASRGIGALEFTKRRFARLYPLYGATLILVIALQALYTYLHGESFVYPPGTPADLVEAATLTSHWWPNSGFFFNGPAWSISVECFLYTVFFLSARFSGSRKTIVFMALVVIGLRLNVAHWPIGRGMESFFMGTLTAQLFTGLRNSAWFKSSPGRVLACALFGGFVLVAALIALPLALDAAAGLIPNAASLANSATRNLAVLLLFPYLVLLLALGETIRPVRSHALKFLGDCSYSIYLLHFPLQLVSVLVADRLGLSREVFLHPVVFIGWFGLLFVVGAASYHGFEAPMQRWIRQAGRSVAARASSVAS